MVRVHLKRMCILLLLDGTLDKYLLHLFETFVEVFYIFTDFVFACFVSYWESGDQMSDYNCGFFLFLLKVISAFALLILHKYVRLSYYIKDVNFLSIWKFPFFPSSFV